MSTRKSGRVVVKLDGNVLTSKPGASLQIGGPRRAFEMSDQGTPHFQETLVPAEIKATLIHVAETDLPALRGFSDGTVTFEDDLGVVYVVNSAATAEFGTLANGEVEITIGGAPAERA